MVKTVQVAVMNAQVDFANAKTSIATSIGMNALIAIALFLDVVSMHVMKIIYWVLMHSNDDELFEKESTCVF